MGSGCGGWLAQVLADQGHLLPGEGAVPALVAGSGEGFDQGVATGYPACKVAHVWGIERSGFFNGREKWAKGFENQRV